MANDQIGTVMYYVMILNAVILAISYWETYKDVHDDGSIIGSRFDLLKTLMSSIYLSMGNAAIGFCIAFVLGAIVIGMGSTASQRNDYGIWRHVMWLVVLLFATSIWGVALNAMGKRWSN